MSPTIRLCQFLKFLNDLRPRTNVLESSGASHGHPLRELCIGYRIWEADAEGHLYSLSTRRQPWQTGVAAVAGLSHDRRPIAALLLLALIGLTAYQLALIILAVSHPAEAIINVMLTVLIVLPVLWFSWPCHWRGEVPCDNHHPLANRNISGPWAGCGIYAFNNLQDAASILAAMSIHHRYQDRTLVLGRIYLWGRVIEHENGYRAKYAYPAELIAASDGDDCLLGLCSQQYGLTSGGRAYGTIAV